MYDEKNDAFFKVNGFINIIILMSTVLKFIQGFPYEMPAL